MVGFIAMVLKDYHDTIKFHYILYQGFIACSGQFRDQWDQAVLHVWSLRVDMYQGTGCQQSR